MNAYIKAISYYLPERIVTNEDLSKEFPEWSVVKVASKVGIHQRHIVGEDETAGDLAEKATLKLFNEYGICPSEIDFLLFCTSSHDYLLPSTACILQDRLGIPTTSGSLDFNLGCSGFVYGLALAKGLIKAGIAKNVMLLTAETYSKHIHQKDKGNRTIFGDAAAAVLISTEGFSEIRNFSLGTDGRGFNNLIVKTGACKHPGKANEQKIDDTGTLISSDHLYMNGPEIFKFTLETVPLLIENTLKANGIEKGNIDLFVFHQANKYVLDTLRKLCGLHADKFYNCIENCGNTVSSTIPIAIKEAIIAKGINEGSLVLLAGFGVGYSWGGCVLQF